MVTTASSSIIGIAGFLCVLFTKLLRAEIDGRHERRNFLDIDDSSGTFSSSGGFSTEDGVAFSIADWLKSGNALLGGSTGLSALGVSIVEMLD